MKAAWNLRVVATGPGRSRLTTETRVLGFGDDARRKFRLYWSVVGPFSGAIRTALLRSVRRHAEGRSFAGLDRELLHCSPKVFVMSRPAKADPRQ